MIATILLIATLLQFLASEIPAVAVQLNKSRRLPRSAQQIPFEIRHDFNDSVHEPAEPEAREAEEQTLELGEEEQEGEA